MVTKISLFCENGERGSESGRQPKQWAVKRVFSAVLRIDKSGRRHICQGQRRDAEVIGEIKAGRDLWRKCVLEKLFSYPSKIRRSWSEGHKKRLKCRCE